MKQAAIMICACTTCFLLGCFAFGFYVKNVTYKDMRIDKNTKRQAYINSPMQDARILSYRLKHQKKKALSLQMTSTN